MAIIEFIEKKKEQLRQDIFTSEAAVSHGILLPALQELGWPIFNTMVVVPEYSEKGYTVDYALCHPASKPIIYLEVKISGISERANLQLIESALLSDVAMAIQTDGQEWSFYLPGEKGRSNDRRIYKLNLMEHTAEEASRSLTNYLAYDRVCSGIALQDAQSDFRNADRTRDTIATFPRAWDALLHERENLLLQLLADKVEELSGYKPIQDDCRQFLQTKISPANKIETEPLKHVELKLTTITHPFISKEPENISDNIAKTELSSASTGRAKSTLLKVTLDWSVFGRSEVQEVIKDNTAVSTYLKTLAKIAKQIGNDQFSELREFRINRGPLLSPERTRYHQHEAAGYYILTYNSTSEKARILHKVVQKLGISNRFLDVEIIQDGPLNKIRLFGDCLKREFDVSNIEEEFDSGCQI